MKKETQNSEAFLNSVLKNSNGLTTPKNYFLEFDTKLETKIFKEQLPKKTGFTISDGYFDNIDSKILSLHQLNMFFPLVKIQHRYQKRRHLVVSLQNCDKSHNQFRDPCHYI